MNNNDEKTCGNCAFGVFAIDEQTQAQLWSGYCAIENKYGKLNKVEQHFKCSCRKWKER